MSAVGLVSSSRSPSPRGEDQASNHDIISVDRPLYSSTVVGVVTTIGIGGRTDVNGGAVVVFAVLP